MTEERGLVRRRRLTAGVAIVSVSAIVAALGWFQWLPHWRPSLERATGERYGIDVAAYQGNIDWVTVAADDISFAYIKATEGGDFTDRDFDDNWRGAGAAGIDRGAYHYFTLCTDGIAQARHFLSIAPPDDNAMAPVVDLEDLTGACNPDTGEVLKQITRFIEEVERFSPRPVVLYIGADFEAKFGLPNGLQRDLWQRSLFRRPSSDNWQLWQFHYRGRVNGIDGDVDLDVMRSS